MKRLPIHGLLVFFLIIFGIVNRAGRLDIAFDPEDTHLDYLAAHQMVRYGQIPLSGSGNPVLIDSPLYYYITAAFVTLNDSLLFLSIVNFVVIQPILFVLFYALASALFGKWVGVFAVALAVTSFEYVAMGSYFFQTNVMQVFANASFLCLALAWRHKRKALLAASVVLLAIALTIHHSVLALLPLFGLLTFRLIPRAQRAAESVRLGALWLGFVSLFHIPVLMLFQAEPASLERVAGSVSAGYIGSPDEYVGKFFANLLQFVYAFSLRWVDNAQVVNGALLLLLVLGGVQFFRRSSAPQRMILGIMIAGILQLVLLASLLRVGVWNFTFTSLAGIYLITVSAVVLRWFSGGLLSKAIGIASVVAVMYAFSNAGYLMGAPVYPRLWRWQLTQESLAAISLTVENIRQAENRHDVSFFQIERVHRKPSGGLFVDVYSPAGIQIIADLLYWPALQQRFEQPFVRMEKDGYFPTILNTDDYVFVICDSTRATFLGSEDCLVRYLSDRPSRTFVRHVYASELITVELVRRSDVARRF